MPDSATIAIEYADPRGRRQTARFEQAFVVGRFADCDVQLPDAGVSRRHLRVFPEDGAWWFQDLDSRNGTLRDGRRIARARLAGPIQLQLGARGPVIDLIPTPRAGDNQHIDHIALSVATGMATSVDCDPAARTISAPISYPPASPPRFDWRRPAAGIGLLSLAGLLGLSAFLVLSERLPLPWAAPASDDPTTAQPAWTTPWGEADSAAETADPVDRMIRTTARALGEDDRTLPAEFVAAVKMRIRAWQATDDLNHAMQRFNDSGFMPVIHQALHDAELPHPVLYLALAVSGFRTDAVSQDTPRRRGFWQLTAEQARGQGILLDARSESPDYDPGDARHQIEPATRAATRVLQEIRRTRSGASGLLTLALYLDTAGQLAAHLPAPPAIADTGALWRLQRAGLLAPEIQDRLLALFAAAVIGENPRFFGFRFDNPFNGVSHGTRRAPPHADRGLISVILNPSSRPA